MTKQKNWGNTVSKLIAKAWIDNSFYQRLIEDPAAVLREAGMILDDFAQVIVNHDSAGPALTAEAGGTMTINLPPKPAGLADQLLHTFETDIVPGGCCCTC